jgi:hypothetical protein
MTLKELALAYSNKMHSKVPAHCRPMKTFSDKSANDLTKAIIAYAKIKDFFAERQSSEGRYRPGKEVYEREWGKRNSCQANGCPDKVKAKQILKH